MRIEIFGPGCAKCEKTAREVERAVKELGVDATVEHVTEMSEIVERGVMLTPAVFVDGDKLNFRSSVEAPSSQAEV